MSGRFSFLNGVVWAGAFLSTLILLFGIYLLLSGPATRADMEAFGAVPAGIRAIAAIPPICFGVFGILISGGVQVLIAIYDKIADAPR